MPMDVRASIVPWPLGSWLPSGARRAARRGRRGPVRVDGQPFVQGVGGSPRPVSPAAAELQPLCVPVHGRDPRPGSPRRGSQGVLAHRAAQLDAYLDRAGSRTSAAQLTRW